jgi:hypothetical protein
MSCPCGMFFSFNNPAVNGRNRLPVEHDIRRTANAVASINAAFDWRAALRAGRLSKLTVAQLREACRENRLPIKGKKGDLVARLEGHGDEDLLLAAVNNRCKKRLHEEDGPLNHARRTWRASLPPQHAQQEPTVQEPTEQQEPTSHLRTLPTQEERNT